MRNILDYIEQVKDMYEGTGPMAQGPRNMYAGGQLVTPSVDGSRPGYMGPEAKHDYVNDSGFLDFQKKNPGKLYDQLKKYERILSKKNKIVGIGQLHEALGPDTPYTFETLNNIFSRADKKITKNMSNVEKNYIRAGQRIKKIIIDTLGEPTTLGEIQKDYKYIKGGTGTSTDKVWDLSKAKINKLNKALLKNYNVTGFRPKTIENIFKLYNDKKLLEAIDAYKGGRLDKSSPIYKKLVKEGAGDLSYAYMQLGRVLRGEIELVGIDKNLKRGNRIVKSLYGDFEGPLGTALLDWSKLQMGKHFDNPNASYDTLVNTVRNAIDDVGIPGVAVDEIFPARTGQLTIGKGSGAYNQIVQVIDEKINSGAKRNFDGQASQRYQDIIEARKNKNWKKVESLVNDHKKAIKNFYENNPQAKGKVKLTKLNYDPVKKRFASPTEIYGKDVFPSKIQKDMDKFYRKTGLSLDVGSTMTLEKAAKDLEKVAGDPKQQIKILKQMGYRCRKAGGAGEDVACYMDDVEKTKTDMKSDNLRIRNAALAKQRKAFDVAAELPKIGKLVRQGVQAGAAGLATAFKWTGLGAPIGYAIEGAIEGGVYDFYRRQGYNHNQAFAETFTPRLAKEAAEGKSTEDVPWYGGAEKLVEKEKIGTRWDPSGKVNLAAKYADAKSRYDEELDKYNLINASMTTYANVADWEKDLNAQAKILKDLEPSIKPGTPEYEAYQTADERQTALMDQRAKDYKSKNKFFGLEWDLSPAQIKQQTPSPFMQEQKQKDRYKAMDEYRTTSWGDPMEAYSLKPGERFNWDAVGFGGEQGIKDKWQQIYEIGGMDLLDKIGIAGGVSKMAGGGIASIRRPGAIPPESGPQPQGLENLKYYVTNT
jgi:hypothetical protein